MLDLGPDDRIYDCLPLYQGTGSVVAIAAALVRGASVLIAPGFRTSRFWDEVIDGDCTVFFYIGELCRYLTQSPPHPRERAHRLRLASGNGLHGSVWQEYESRFALPQILEFYAATEGNVSLYNCEGKPGAIGRIPPFGVFVLTGIEKTVANRVLDAIRRPLVGIDRRIAMSWRLGAAYSQDLRDRVFVRFDAGEAVGDIAEALCVTVSYVSKVLSRRKLTGEVSARPQRCHVGPKLAGLYEAIQAEVASRPDATLAELCRWLAQTYQVTASIALMHGTLGKLGLTHKKRRCTLLDKNVPMLPKLGSLGAMASPV